MSAVSRPDHDRLPLLPVLAVLAAVALWGGSFPAMKVAVRAMSPEAMMWTRMFVAALALAPFARRLLPRGIERRDLKPLAATILLMPCAYFLLESNAMRFTTASQAGVIASSVPLLVAVGARLFLGEAFGRRAALGLTAAMAGAVWLTLAGTPTESAANPLLGNSLELMAMACAAGSMLCIKHLSRRIGPWTLTALQTFAGVVFFSPGAPEALAGLTGGWDTATVLALVFLGAGVTLAAFGCYNWGLSRLPAGSAAAWINLVPVVAVVLGWTLLGERLSLGQCGAAALVLAGVLASQGGQGSVSGEAEPIPAGASSD